ncbi:MAG: M28 family peptidase [Thermodesulfobacteriota bacterium]|nr:M28 family peptidase [Thermodesulfobacteriota bacterium]
MDKITEKQIKDTFSFTDEIVNDFPGRLIGTNACKGAAKRIAEEFEKNCDPGTVKTESFTCHPKAFLKYIRPAVILYGISTCLALISRPFKAFLGLLVPASAFVSQFALYKEVFDPLFPEEEGVNVYGTIEPEGEVKQQIILCGHHDAAYIFHFMDKSPKMYPYLIVAGVVPMLLGLFFTLYMAITRTSPGWMKKALVGGLAGVIPMWWFTTDAVSPAAGDNMIATAMANEGAKIFADKKKAGQNPLKHTRIICLSVDGEEAGLRGSRAFAKKHAGEFQDIKTYAFCMDTLYNKDKLIFFDNDLNLTVDLSHEMAQELTDIALDLGYKAKVSHMPWGGGSTDAPSFANVGVESTCLLAFELDVTKLDSDLVYHTPRDTTDAIEPQMVEQVLDIIQTYIRKKDQDVSSS